jgi:hypothetical protein
MRKENDPAVADPVVKANFTFGRVGFEIRGSIANIERHENLRRLG